MSASAGTAESTAKVSTSAEVTESATTVQTTNAEVAMNMSRSQIKDLPSTRDATRRISFSAFAAYYGIPYARTVDLRRESIDIAEQNSPFHGRTFHGGAIATVVEGELKWRR